MRLHKLVITALALSFANLAAANPPRNICHYFDGQHYPTWEKDVPIFGGMAPAVIINFQMDNETDATTPDEIVNFGGNIYAEKWGWPAVFNGISNGSCKPISGTCGEISFDSNNHHFSSMVCNDVMPLISDDPQVGSNWVLYARR